MAAREDDAAAPPPYQIQITNFLGGNASSNTGLSNSELYFAIDWDPSAAREYNPDCMETPVLHSSTAEARAKSWEGAKPVKLQDCLEVSLQIVHRSRSHAH